MTELELKQLEDKVNKAKGIASNIHTMKIVVAQLNNNEDEDQTKLGISYLGRTIYIYYKR